MLLIKGEQMTLTKYRTDEPSLPTKNFWKHREWIWIEELDENGEGKENYHQISRDKYFELCKNGKVVDAEELGIYP